jgi:hypothetical protein
VRFKALQAVIQLYIVAIVKRKFLNIVRSLERRLNRLGIALDLKGCMLDIKIKNKVYVRYIENLGVYVRY